MHTTKMPDERLVVHADPEIMSGVPVFLGTRVPVQTLFDYLMDGCSIDEFLDNFPTVSREQVIKLLTCASLRALEGVATP
jgi:uncharacterized protein (DUF433 family)